MKVNFNMDRRHSLKKPIAVALGAFDGLHIGHQILCQQLKLIKKSTGCSTMVYTFLDNPLEFLSPDKSPTRITTASERIFKFREIGIDHLILNPFDRQLASMTPEDFITDVLLKNYNIKFIVVGYDFRFGIEGRGDTDLLNKMGLKLGFDVIVVPPVSLGDKIISSSLIRELIKNGIMGEVSTYLGSPYSISGKIVRGFGRGKKLGFPTANLEFNKGKVIPQFGIYLTKVKKDNAYYWGLTNVGINPTFNKKGLFVETYILDYDDDIYGDRIKVEFLKRIRGEERFSNIEDLKRQIAKDVQWAKNYIYKF
ncbi:MAG TPA: bifunctional riboflavin kinase/FAD synthetase [Clostridia bacterium]|nr:bifunctional riboflavin kinase/FAD synthetase [Clostridia bacterium]